MRRLPLSTLIAALAATLLSAPALAEQGASHSQIGGGGSNVVVDNAATGMPPVDVCPNLDGVQDSVPAHLILDPHGHCIHEPSPEPGPEPSPEPIHHDVCPNLDGVQDSVPAHLILDPHGHCIHEPSPEPGPEPSPEPIHHDVCPNLDGVQDSVPAHLILDPHGHCIHEPSPSPAPSLGPSPALSRSTTTSVPTSTESRTASLRT